MRFKATYCYLGDPLRRARLLSDETSKRDIGNGPFAFGGDAYKRLMHSRMDPRCARTSSSVAQYPNDRKHSEERNYRKRERGRGHLKMRRKRERRKGEGEKDGHLA